MTTMNNQSIGSPNYLPNAAYQHSIAKQNGIMDNNGNYMQGNNIYHQQQQQPYISNSAYQSHEPCMILLFLFLLV